MQFAPIGIPVRDAGLFGYTVGPGPAGQLDTVYLSFFQSQAPWFVVGVDMVTGECRHYQGQREEGCWAIAAGPDDCIYTGTCTREGRVNRIRPATGEVQDLGPAVPGESYIWRLVLGPDGFLYGSTYPHAKLFRLDPASGKTVDLGSMDPSEQYNRDLVAAGDLIYCAIGTVQPKVVAYDVRRGTKHVILLPGLDISGTPLLVKSESGEVYCRLNADRYGNRSYCYHIAGLEAQPVESVPEARLAKLADGRRLKAASDKVIRLVAPDGREERIPYTYQGAGALLFVLRNGPDGPIYGSTALPLRLFRLDPASGEMANLGNPTDTGGEIYSLLAKEGRLYTCAYTRATLTVWDPALPWAPADAESPAAETPAAGRTVRNPYSLGIIGEGQDRAPAMIGGPDGAIYIGTVPTYGELGGALTRLDPSNHTWVVHRHIVPEQSVVSLAADAKRNRVYAGSSVQGGGGAIPRAELACLFAWDCAAQAKAGEWQPFARAREITALAVAGRCLFGFSSDGKLFVFDLDAERVVHVVEPGLGRAYMQALEPYEKSRLLGMLGDHIVSIDVSTYEVTVLGTYPGITAGFAINGGQVYFGSKAELVRGIL